VRWSRRSGDRKSTSVETRTQAYRRDVRGALLAFLSFPVFNHLPQSPAPLNFGILNAPTF
jgi:hypothetical protein